NYLEADAARNEETKRADERDKARKEAEHEATEAKKRADERDKARKDAVRDAAEAKKQALLAHTALHAIQIDQALQARLKFEHFRIGKLLTEMRPEYHQAWETRYVRNLWLKEAWPHRVFVGHRGPVVSVCFSPDGKTVLTASADQTASLWDA